MVTAHVAVNGNAGEPVLVWPLDGVPHSGFMELKVRNPDSSHAVELLGDPSQDPGTGYSVLSGGGVWDSTIPAADKVWALGLTTSAVTVEVSATQAR